MKQIFISKQIAYAAKVGGGTISGINEINLLDTGAIACFAEDNTILSAAGIAAEIADKKRIYIAVGNQLTNESGSYISTLIPRLGTSYHKQAYVAPVKQKKFVGYDGTTAGTALNYPTLVAGDTAFIRITRTTTGMRPYPDEIERYEVMVVTGETPASLTAKIVSAINANTSSIVVAAGVAVNTGISLETKDAQDTFDVALDGVIQFASMVEKGAAVEGVSVAPNFGQGTYDQVKALEDSLSVSARGNTNLIEQSALWYKNTSLAVAGLTYNVYTLTWHGRRESSTGPQDSYIQEVKLAIPSSGTAPTTALETIFAEVFGNPETYETGA